MASAACRYLGPAAAGRRGRGSRARTCTGSGRSWPSACGGVARKPRPRPPPAPLGRRASGRASPKRRRRRSCPRVAARASCWSPGRVSHCPPSAATLSFCRGARSHSQRSAHVGAGDRRPQPPAMRHQTVSNRRRGGGAGRRYGQQLSAVSQRTANVSHLLRCMAAPRAAIAHVTVDLQPVYYSSPY